MFFYLVPQYATERQKYNLLIILILQRYNLLQHMKNVARRNTHVTIQM
jgi:hypothetical protein